jgi:hypothetical protein
MIKGAKIKYQYNLVASLENSTPNSKDWWKFAKSACSKTNMMDIIPPLLHEDGSITSNDDEKCEALAAAFARISHIDGDGIMPPNTNLRTQKTFTLSEISE